METNHKKTKNILDGVSPSFCPAKWLQVTLHLSNGHNHSCHHPDTHKADIELIKNNPSALHNTEYKLKLRDEMLRGVRPSECHYCWKMEDASIENTSDRIIKASDPWASCSINSVVKSKRGENINPSYLEVSFDGTCNLRCIYCGPHISSSLLWEYERFGDYRFMESLEDLRQKGKFATPDEQKIYTEAFWKWFPTLITELEVLRITGGEPLLSGNTFKLLRGLKNFNCEKLDLSINSNLAVSELPYQKFMALVEELLEENTVKSFSLYASIDGIGPTAEYVRYGLDSDQFFERVEDYLNRVETPLVFMITYHLISISEFDKLLHKICELKKRYGTNRVTADISMLSHPDVLAPTLADDELIEVSVNSLELMEKLKYSDYETEKFRRIVRTMNAVDQNSEDIARSRKDCTEFIPIYDQRKGTDFLKTFPALNKILQNWKKRYGEETK